jgi:SAM-dependent methyltransferase
MPGLAAEFYTDAAAPHLGGYIKGGDPATYFPDLWDWLVFVRGVRSVLDVGCGEGQALDHFAELGCRVIGVDGVEQEGGVILCHDYTQGPLTIQEEFDLAWSCEFVEHVEEAYVACFLATFRAARAVLMTHAEPGQPGHHHVNCQPAEYWKGAMAAAGFRYDEEFTREARGRAALNRNPINHFARAGLVFVSE